jgi:hypothetical protein
VISGVTSPSVVSARLPQSRAHTLWLPSGRMREIFLHPLHNRMQIVK